VLKCIFRVNFADPTFAYDAAGYITAETVSGTLLNYDSLGRLIQVSNTSGAVIGQYTYDGMNRRITKTVGGTTTIYLYDIYNNLIGEYDASTGNTTKEYVYLGSKALAMISEPTTSSSSGCGSINTGCSTVGISMHNRGSMGMGAVDGFIYLFPLIGIAIIRIGRKAKKHKLDIIGLLVTSGMIIMIIMVSTKASAQVTGEQVYYYHIDHLGTPVVMTDQNQNIVWQASYDPFGQATITTATITNNLRFPGMYSDSETGLYYNMNRYYYPAIGRYIEPDPLNIGTIQLSNEDLIDYGSDTKDLTALFLNNPQNQNLYPYVRNNPINLTDPEGLMGVFHFHECWKCAQQMAKAREKCDKERGKCPKDWDKFNQKYGGIGDEEAMFNCVKSKTGEKAYARCALNCGMMAY